jgi:hypothetical protein
MARKIKPDHPHYNDPSHEAAAFLQSCIDGLGMNNTLSNESKDIVRKELYKIMVKLEKRR